MKHYKVLLLPQGFSIAMLIARMVYTHTWEYAFLIWNLFLAFLPLVFSGFVTSACTKPRACIYAVTWLLFFPNSAYIITDFIHLQELQGAPVWFDAILIFSFALNGLLMGMMSLREVEQWLKRQLPTLLADSITVLMRLLSGFGIYLGRVKRWNSWDVVTNPLSLLYDVYKHISHPLVYKEGWLLSIVFALWMFAISKLMVQNVHQ